MESTTGADKRPLGVAVIALVVMAFGALTALFGLAGMLVGSVSGIMDSPRGGGREFLAGVAGLVLGAAYVVAGIGHGTTRAWAWWLATLAGVVGFVVAFGSPVWMVLWAGLVVYLILVRGNFGVLKAKPAKPLVNV